MWKKVLETQDVIIHEARLPEVDVRIEARKNEGNNEENSEHNEKWTVYMRYITKPNERKEVIDYTEEFICKDIDESKEIIACLKASKIKDTKDIINLKIGEKKEVRLDIRRTSRDYNSEGWVFKVNKEDHNNRLFIRDSDDVTEVDIILSELYRYCEERILERLVDMLGLSSCDKKTKITVYYCKDDHKYFLEEGCLENLQTD
jgi:hypothetical protein